MAAAYVATARIDHGKPRFVAASTTMRSSLEAWPPLATAAERVVDAPPADPTEIELRWEAFRERWAQLWFFVRDPESWR